MIADNGMSLSEAPNELRKCFNLWNDAIQACKDHQLNPEAMLKPEKHRGYITAFRRRKVIGDLSGKGWKQEAIETVCPCSRMTVWRSKQEGKNNGC